MLHWSQCGFCSHVSGGFFWMCSCGMLTTLIWNFLFPVNMMPEHSWTVMDFSFESSKLCFLSGKTLSWQFPCSLCMPTIQILHDCPNLQGMFERPADFVVNCSLENMSRCTDDHPFLHILPLMDELNETDKVEHLREPINEGGPMTMAVLLAKVLNPNWFWCVLFVVFDLSSKLPWHHESNCPSRWLCTLGSVWYGKFVRKVFMKSCLQRVWTAVTTVLFCIPRFCLCHVKSAQVCFTLISCWTSFWATRTPRHQHHHQ